VNNSSAILMIIIGVIFLMVAFGVMGVGLALIYLGLAFGFLTSGIVILIANKIYGYPDSSENREQYQIQRRKNVARPKD
jgi:hypothetical protein